MRSLRPRESRRLPGQFQRLSLERRYLRWFAAAERSAHSPLSIDEHKSIAVNAWRRSHLKALLGQPLDVIDFAGQEQPMRRIGMKAGRVLFQSFWRIMFRINCDAHEF